MQPPHSVGGENVSTPSLLKGTSNLSADLCRKLPEGRVMGCRNTQCVTWIACIAGTQVGRYHDLTGSVLCLIVTRVVAMRAVIL